MSKIKDQSLANEGKKLLSWAASFIDMTQHPS